MMRDALTPPEIECVTMLLADPKEFNLTKTGIKVCKTSHTR